MSRIGRMPITIPEGVKVVLSDKLVTVTGPKGTLSEQIADRNISIKIEGNVCEVIRTDEAKATKARHGLYRQLINNMVCGVSKPYSKTLIIVGVGFKSSVTNGKLVMNIGFSHPVEFMAPEGITLACPDLTSVTITGIDKALVGQTAATIKSKRPVEPYHNYGLHYSDEVLVKKEGKTAGK